MPMTSLSNHRVAPWNSCKTAGFHHTRRGNSRIYLRLSSDSRKISPPVGYSSFRRRSSHNCSLNSDNNGAVTVENETPVRIVVLVGEGSVSPLKSTPWSDVMIHTAKKLKWIDEGFEMLVFSDDKTTEQLQEAIGRANILVIVAVTNQESVKWMQTCCQDVSNVICFDSSPVLTNKLGGSLVQMKTEGSVFSNIPLPQTKKVKESEEVVKSVFEAWNRHNSDDIQFCLLVIINTYIRPVSTLKNLRAKGFSTLNCMVKNCGPQILNCLLDPNCRKALQCLNNCSPVDQVCNYRCLAS